MRFLLIPLDFHKHSDDRMFGDMLRAFQKSGDAMMFDTMDKAIDFKPDVIFYQGSLNKDQQHHLKNSTDAQWVTWTGDVRYAPMPHLQELKDVTDLFLLPFTGELLNTYSDLLQKPCGFIFEPFQNWKFIEPKEMNEGRITFIGNDYHHLQGQRSDTLSFINEYHQIISFGTGKLTSNISNFLVPGIYNESYAVICENNWNDIDDYFTPRNLNAMSAGSCALMRTFPGIERHFVNWQHCIYYRHKYELLDVIDFIKNNPDVRNRIAKAGYQLTKENFTFDNFVQQFIKQL